MAKHKYALFHTNDAYVHIILTGFHFNGKHPGP